MLYPILLMLYMRGPVPPVIIRAYSTETECKREIEKLSGGWTFINSTGYMFLNGVIVRCEPEI